MTHVEKDKYVEKYPYYSEDRPKEIDYDPPEFQVPSDDPEDSDHEPKHSDHNSGDDTGDESDKTDSDESNDRESDDDHYYNNDDKEQHCNGDNDDNSDSDESNQNKAQYNTDDIKSEDDKHNTDDIKSKDNKAKAPYVGGSAFETAVIAETIIVLTRWYQKPSFINKSTTALTYMPWNHPARQQNFGQRWPGAFKEIPEQQTIKNGETHIFDEVLKQYSLDIACTIHDFTDTLRGFASSIKINTNDKVLKDEIHDVEISTMIPIMVRYLWWSVKVPNIEFYVAVCNYLRSCGYRRCFSPQYMINAEFVLACMMETGRCLEYRKFYTFEPDPASNLS